jgi:hypothetical protein
MRGHTEFGGYVARFQGNLPLPSSSWICSESVSELLCNWRFATNQFVLVLNHLRFTVINFFYQLNHCGHSPYVISFLTRGWVCSLQFLLAIASTVILGAESCGLMTIFCCLRFEIPPNLKGQVTVLISLRNRMARLYPQGLGTPFLRLPLRWKYWDPPSHGILNR